MSNSALRKNKIQCKPFIKWAGGKSQLINQLLSRLPSGFNNYFEPFIGGGALYFALQPAAAYLSDLNPELINAYQVVQTDVENLIIELSKHIYEANYFYKIRDWDRDPDFLNLPKVKRAARLLYLNRSCFNGLYRLNSKGYFNVPFGRYTNPLICNAENLRACSSALQDTKLKIDGFDHILSVAKKGDFVYLDPPYVPISKTSSFTKYSKHDFGQEQQEQLAQVCHELDRSGVNFMLSNSQAELVQELYKNYNIESVLATRSINSKGNSRGEIHELIIRNYSSSN